ncbi:MAG: peptidylprolyl isomerase [Anaerolineae bacterium]|nr:peptidylprolyl isomerase [Anaerolineae bacterium]
MRKFFPLVVLLLLVAACGPVATPEVIRDNSRSITLTAMVQPTMTPTGPTLTPTLTSTPYSRPTDSSALDLSQPIVKVYDETITLGQFRARVRYERFKQLNTARRIIESVGLDKFDFSKPSQDQTVTTVAGIFNTLANSGRFGRDVYDVMVREAVTRHEFQKRALKLGETDVADFWVREFELQLDKDARSKVPDLLNKWAEVAAQYAGITRQELDALADASVKADVLRPIVGSELASAPEVLTYTIKRIIAATQADADSALAALNGGADFRQVACQYSTDPAVLGNRGNLGFVTRGQLTAGLQNSDQLFSADVGTVVGPLSSPLGFHVFKINGKKQNADGDTLVDVQTIVVATEALAKDIQARATAGTDFAALACQYSLDSTGGNGGDYGAVSEQDLPSAVSIALNQIKPDQFGKLVGPIAAEGKFEVILLQDRKINIPKPTDLDDAKKRAFTDWLAREANSSAVTSYTESWKDAIPTDPLPRDVAAFMKEENFNLPTPAPTTATPNSEATSTPAFTPTPSPTIATP